MQTYSELVNATTEEILAWMKIETDPIILRSLSRLLDAVENNDEGARLDAADELSVLADMLGGQD